MRNRAVHTEDQLARWRSVAAGRRRAFELAQWVAAEQARRRRRRWLKGLRGVVTTMMVFALSVGAVAVNPGPNAEARSPAPLMSEEASVPLASGTLAADGPLLAALDATAPSSLDEIEPVHWVPSSERLAMAVDAFSFVGPPPLPPATAEPAVGVDQDSVKQWNDDEYRWITFDVQTQEPTWMRWRDPSGAYPIEDMPCAFPTETSHQCRAGRSHFRIDRALRDGARAGTWTIEACVGDVCEAVDTVQIAID